MKISDLERALELQEERRQLVASEELLRNLSLDEGGVCDKLEEWLPETVQKMIKHQTIIDAMAMLRAKQDQLEAL